MTRGTQPPDWASIRLEYEGRTFLPTVICKRHGITEAQLRYRREMEGWLSARARVPKQADLVARMLKVLDKQIRKLEGAVDEPIDKQVKALADSVKTLDNLIKQGAAKPNVEPASRKDVADLRAKLVKRLEQSAR
jgi:non-homologous end joining protein Ku